ncbi:lariat debranching enzyme, C-terminal domain-containing protein [Crucibulum laeve]|uniref:Lariat debranching enzyme, C-terminal domain-containing protein n=1 Tax=Crucibulum laeve TaxID=68775 RepID=A0A5C3LX73_9AGAR|nr:lariat debranching enzyme, C-terminal domain-containing protein [Crucibulum laeve]
MKIAVEGCCHGELDMIYSHLSQLETRNGYEVDLLLICGDFQAMRNHQDLQCMACPPKYRALHDFYKYYTGDKIAPVLTIIIGGNHEASNYMWELYHGGWVAPNIYFLGHAGCVQVNGVRIAGSSGIYKDHDFGLGHYEKLPYDNRSMRSIYHTREYCIRKLSLLSSPRIFMSHDWPQSIEQHGDTNGLLRRKTFFRSDVQNDCLGSPPLKGLLYTLKPEWWFSAHLHARFEARVDYLPPIAAPPLPPVANPDEIVIEDDEFDVEPAAAKPEEPVTEPPRNPDEILLDDEEETVEVAPPPSSPPLYPTTNFLALDKCLKNRHFLEVIDIPINSDATSTVTSDPSSPHHPSLGFDPEWLAISRAFHPWLSTTHQQRPFPPEAEARELVRKELQWVENNVKTDEHGVIPVLQHQVFMMTAPGPGSEGAAKMQQPPWYTNPQTEAFCRMLQIENKINPPPPGVKPNAALAAEG